MRIRSIVLVLILNVCYVVPYFATTIIPYKNMGELSKFSDAVIVATMVKKGENELNSKTTAAYKFVIDHVIKGDVSINENIIINSYSSSTGELHRSIWGDAKYTENQQYLLFLDRNAQNLWRPICLSYYVYETKMIAGEEVFMPTPEQMELSVEGDGQTNLVFKKSALIKGLAHYLAYPGEWQQKRMVHERSDAIMHQHHRAAPNHCVNLFGSTPTRWTGFPDEPLNIYASSKAACAGFQDAIKPSVELLNSKYGGINLNVAGGVDIDFSSDCSGSSSIIRDYMVNTLRDRRNIIIVFDDPCDEINDLQFTTYGWAGVLAFGGSYSGGGQHTYDGETYNASSIGYVVTNNGLDDSRVGYCSSRNFQTMMVHELGHVLGLGHIQTQYGKANMNPSCCEDINSLDQGCMDHLYAKRSALPVTWTDISVRIKEDQATLTWEIAEAVNHDYFTVERSEDEHTWKALDIVDAEANFTNKSFQYLDRLNHAGMYHYRLKAVDLDGSFAYSTIVSAELASHNLTDKLFYTADSKRLHIRQQKEGQLHIVGADGKTYWSKMIPKGYTDVRLPKLRTGLYIVQITTEGITKHKKIFVGG